MAKHIEGPKGAYLIPREDVPASEGCFRFFQETGAFLGFVQKFKDGTYGFWKVPKAQARPAATLEVVLEKLLACPATAFRDTCHSACYRPLTNPRGLVFRFIQVKNAPPGTLKELDMLPCPCGCGGVVPTERK